MKQLRRPLFYLQWILIFFSIIAFLLANIEGFKMIFDFSSTAFQTYLKLFNPYTILFAATFVVITAYLAIERLGIMSDANATSFKASNRTYWMQIVREFLTEIKISDLYMAKDITKQLLIIHDYLFERQYKLSTKEETLAFCNKFFTNKIPFFEEMNTTYMNIAYYKDENQSYSWDAFRYMILVMIDEPYPDFVADLQDLYKKEVLKFSKKHVNKSLYEIGLNDYSTRKRNFGTEPL